MFLLSIKNNFIEKNEDFSRLFHLFDIQLDIFFLVKRLKNLVFSLECHNKSLTFLWRSKSFNTHLYLFALNIHYIVWVKIIISKVQRTLRIKPKWETANLSNQSKRTALLGTSPSAPVVIAIRSSSQRHLLLKWTMSQSNTALDKYTLVISSMAFQTEKEGSSCLKETIICVVPTHMMAISRMAYLMEKEKSHLRMETSSNVHSKMIKSLCVLIHIRMVVNVLVLLMRTVNSMVRVQ